MAPVRARYALPFHGGGVALAWARHAKTFLQAHKLVNT